MEWCVCLAISYVKMTKPIGFIFTNESTYIVSVFIVFNFSSVGLTMYKGSIVILKIYMLSFQRKYLFLSPLSPKSGLKKRLSVYCCHCLKPKKVQKSLYLFRLDFQKLCT